MFRFAQHDTHKSHDCGFVEGAVAMEGELLQTRSFFFNYENDSNDSFARVRLVCRSLFSLGQTARHCNSSHARPEVESGCGAPPGRDSESRGRKKKHRAAARISHAHRAAALARDRGKLEIRNSKQLRQKVASTRKLSVYRVAYNI